MSTELRQKIESLCLEVETEFVRDFFSRMDEDYFATFSPEEICTHLKLSHGLSLEDPVQCKITRRGEDEFDIIIVGYDYLSEFSIFCGLLSAFGLNIQTGNIYSFSRQSAEKAAAQSRSTHRLRHKHPSPRRIVDVFNARLNPGEVFDEARQQEFVNELKTLVGLLAKGSPDRARDRLNRYLTERLEKMDEQLVSLLSPVEVRFDNYSSPEWTVIDVRSRDAFAFLYAFSNALAMRGIYIHKVMILSSNGEIRDQFFIADKWGHKIESDREQERLRTAVLVIKQFTRFLPEAPDPALAMRRFDQFLDKIAEEQISDRHVSYFTSNEGMNLLAYLLGSSDYLWDDFLRMHFKDFLPILEDLANTELKFDRQSIRDQLTDLISRAPTFEEKKNILNNFKDRQVFLIDVKHLIHLTLAQSALEDFSQALSILAEVVLDAAAAICYEDMIEQHGHPLLENGILSPFTICGLGKFGGREMGYASDLEVLFVYDGSGRTSGNRPLDFGLFYEYLVQKIVEFIETRDKGIFHLDLRLRPHGKAGPLATPFNQLMNYYSEGGEAAPFERQSLIKLRWVAGNEILGRRVEQLRDRFTYSTIPWDCENALHLRQRQARELVKPGQTNVKYSFGGIIDIEYTAQYLQLLHGSDNPELRTPNTLETLDRLWELQLISNTEHEELRSAYLFLRNLIDALRIVRGDASDLVLPEESSDEFKSLARRLGYREKDRKKSAEQLATDIRSVMKRVHTLYLARFNKSEL